MANPTQGSAKVKKPRTAVLWFAAFQIIFSIFCFIGGVVEAVMAESSGQGIWCSICPLIAGILLSIIGSKTVTNSQIQMHIVFSTLGSITMMVMVFIESVIMNRDYSYSYRSTGLRPLRVMVCFAGSFNAILLIISASMFCCRCQKPRTNDDMYVAYHPLQTPQSGMTGNPQTVAMAPSSQMMTMAPNPQVMAMAPGSQMMYISPNPQMMTMAPNPQMMVMNGVQMQQFGFGQQGYPIMFAQPQFQHITSQQVAPQQSQPNSPTQPELPEYQATENKTVPQTNES